MLFFFKRFALTSCIYQDSALRLLLQLPSLVISELAQHRSQVAIEHRSPGGSEMPTIFLQYIHLDIYIYTSFCPLGVGSVGYTIQTF